MHFLLIGQMLGVNPQSFIWVGCEISRKNFGNIQNSDLQWLTREWPHVDTTSA